MFTGIIEATAEMLAREGESLTIGRPASFDDVKVGSSIAVSGVCLTVTELTHASMRFETIPETLERTKLGDLQPGDIVHLERAMKADARLDGHIVQGHVEGVATVARYSLLVTRSDTETRNQKPETSNESYELTIQLPDNLAAFVIPKGSIAIDGVSLTVKDVQGNLVRVALIPHTLRETALGNLREGSRVNIETDVFLRKRML